MTGPDLLAEYGSEWVLHLIPLCSPRAPHQHNAEPCPQPGKAPVMREWQRLSDERRLRGVSPEQVETQMANHLARGNIGLAVPRGCIALDADNAAAAQHLAQACPDAPLQRTHKGVHALFRLPPGLEISNTCRVQLQPGLDVDLRGLGAQIVVWPSTHQTGTPYTWERALPASPSELPLLPLAWQRELEGYNRDGGQRRRSPEEWRQLVSDGVREGERHSALCSIAGAVLASGLRTETATELLLAWNEARCRPPLPRDEAARIIADIAARERAKQMRKDDSDTRYEERFVAGLSS